MRNLTTSDKSILIKLASNLPTKNKTHQTILRMRRVAADRDWFDGDRGAPKTPWGLAQDAWEIARGVTWYSTAGHGGLKVAAGVARAMLTDAARKLGLNWGGSYWYEEDVAWAIPFYEHPEWDAVLSRKSGSRQSSPENVERTLRQNYPEYFSLRDEGYALPATPKPGDQLEFKDTVRWGGGYVFQPGDVVTVVSAKRSGSVVFTHAGRQFGLPSSFIADGKVVVANRRTASQDPVDSDTLAASLRQFSGGGGLTRTGFPPVLITAGVRYLCETASSWWLVDVIASHQTSRKVRPEEFQVWTLTLGRSGGATIVADDGNGNKIASQRIPYTDFPLPKIKLYCVRNPGQVPVVMLPNEYWP
jgi:hypothetical protein